jgi:hypothetical protein
VIGAYNKHGSDEKCIQNCNRNILSEETARRPRHRWEDNIRTDLRGIEWEGVNWMNLARVRDKWLAVVNTVMNLQAP